MEELLFSVSSEANGKQCACVITGDRDDIIYMISKGMCDSGEILAIVMGSAALCITVMGSSPDEFADALKVAVENTKKKFGPEKWDAWIARMRSQVGK